MESSMPDLRRQVRVALYRAGTDLSRWAREHGYKPGTVHETIRYAARRPGYVPRGKLTAAIAADLERDLGLKLVEDAPRP